MLGCSLTCLSANPITASIVELKLTAWELMTSIAATAGMPPPHAVINEIIQRSLGTAKIPYHLEPTGLCRSDGKRPDGASIVPWRGGKVLVWDDLADSVDFRIRLP